jgi:hypothetical protein
MCLGFGETETAIGLLLEVHWLRHCATPHGNFGTTLDRPVLLAGGGGEIMVSGEAASAGGTGDRGRISTLHNGL